MIGRASWSVFHMTKYLLILKKKKKKKSIFSDMHMYIYISGMCIGWVELRSYFNPINHDWLKKI